MMEKETSLKVGRMLEDHWIAEEQFEFVLPNRHVWIVVQNVSVWRSSIDLVASRIPSIRRNESAVPKTKMTATVNASGTMMGEAYASLQEAVGMRTISNCLTSRSASSVTRSQLADPLQPLDVRTSR
jgi:hypothetical protein